MKFIRDIISEKRGIASAGAPQMPRAQEHDRLEVPANWVPSARQARPPFHAPALPDALLSPPAITVVKEDFVFKRFPEDEDVNLEPVDAYEGEDEEVSDAPSLPHAGPGEEDLSSIRAGLAAPDLAEKVEIDQSSLSMPLYLDASLHAVKPAPAFERPNAAEPSRQSAAIRPASGVSPHEPAQDACLGDALVAEKIPELVTPSAPTAVRAEPAFVSRLAESPDQHLSLSEMPFVSVQATNRQKEAAPDVAFEVPPPAAGRGASRSGRVKTRLLGFSPESVGLSNPFEKAEGRANDAFPVGWLVVVAGPGRGAAIALHDGVSRVGRGEDQTVCLNFGDNSISRENHVSIAFDSEQSAFYIGQSGRSNIVRLNNKPLLSTEQIRSGDQIRVGETTLRLVALCGDGFSWTANP